MKLSPYTFNLRPIPPCTCAPQRGQYSAHNDACPAGDVTTWVPLPTVTEVRGVEVHISWVSGVLMASVMEVRAGAAAGGDMAVRVGNLFLTRFREALTGTLPCTCIATGSECAACKLRTERLAMVQAAVAMRRAQRVEYAAFLALPGTEKARDFALNGDLRMDAPDLREENDIPSVLAARYMEKALALAKEYVR